MIDLELLSEYQAWRDDHEGLDRDVTPLAFQAYRRALDNEDKLDRIMRLGIPRFIADDETYNHVSVERLLEQVIEIIGQEAERE